MEFRLKGMPGASPDLRDLGFRVLWLLRFGVVGLSVKNNSSQVTAIVKRHRRKEKYTTTSLSYIGPTCVLLARYVS